MRTFYTPIWLLVCGFTLTACAAGDGDGDGGKKSPIQLVLINSISPHQGKAGDSVTLKGQGFDLNKISAVRFGEVSAIVMNVNDAKTTMTVLVPAQPTFEEEAMNVSFFDGNDQIAKKSDGFTYLSQIDCQLAGNAPVISNVQAVNLLSDDSLVISGSNFLNGVLVNLSTTALSTVSGGTSNIQITATLPNNVDALCQQNYPCSLPVKVANPNGCAMDSQVQVQSIGVAVEKTILSTSPGNQFGTAIVPLGGDANGDSLPDFAVLSTKDVSMQSGHLGPISNTIWERDLSTFCPVGIGGFNTTTPYQSHMVPAGDPDQDGIKDFMIYQRGVTTSHKHFCMISADGLETDSFSIANSGIAYGAVVEVVNDLTGDGRVDYLIGRDYQNNGSALFGMVSVLSGANFYDGNPSNNNVPIKDFGVASTEFPYGYGSAVTNLGDINGDSSQDILVTAYQYNIQGALYVYSAAAIRASIGTSTNPVYTKIVTPPYVAGALDHRFGLVVSKIGDLDGDSKGDVLISATAAQSLDLVVFAYSSADIVNPATGNPAPLFRLVIPEAGAAALSRAGDTDGDGHEDFMIGAHDFTGFNFNAGRLLVFSGDFTLGEQPNLLFQRNGSGGIAFERFSYSIAPLGDINNDGIDEILAGSPDAPAGDAVYLFNKDSDFVF